MNYIQLKTVVKTREPHTKVVGRKSRFHKIKPILVLLVIFLLVFVIYFINNARTEVEDLGSVIGIDTSADAIADVILSKDYKLKKSDSGYTNLLLLGIDTRPSNASVINTDVIMVLHYEEDSPEHLSIISIPRDVVFNNNGDRVRVNSAFNIGMQRGDNSSGMAFAMEKVASIVGQEIHYGVLLNFESFRKIIDAVGGIDVVVENSFTDYRYPNDYDGREDSTVSFTKGLSHMDGFTALKFSRSRHSLDNNEGSDFARNRRQQLVIKALMDKVVREKKFLDYQFVLDTLDIVKQDLYLYSVSLSEIRYGVELLQKKGVPTVYGVTTDLAFGNWSLLTDRESTAGFYYVSPKAGNLNYADLHRELDIFTNAPDIYTVRPRITIKYCSTATESVNFIYADIKSKFSYTSIEKLITEENHNGTIYYPESLSAQVNTLKNEIDSIKDFELKRVEGINEIQIYTCL